MPDHQAQALPVSAVAKFLYTLVSQNFNSIWIRGEVSNLKVQQNGNAFLSLKDSEAKMNAVIMANSQAKRHIKDLKNGDEVIIFGKPSYYKKEGYISVFIDALEFVGEGILKKRFEELKKKLEAEGLFDRSRKRAIPRFPEWVGVVTSPTGAAIQDILNITRRRFSSNILVFPTAVQGEAAAQEIALSIEAANRLAGDLLDVLIVGRGGGSLEDLWCFNEEAVARAIHASRVPVISAVGHEIDYTIADYVADLRAPTPSAAAELVMQDRESVLRIIENMRKRIDDRMKTRIDNTRLVLENRGGNYIKRALQGLLTENRMTLQGLQNRFDTHFERTITELKNSVKIKREKLEALNPVGILERGYSITYIMEKDGSLRNITSAETASEDDRIQTVLSKGKLESIISRRYDN